MCPAPGFSRQGKGKSLAAEGKPFGYQVFRDSGHRLREAEALPAMLDWLNRTTVKPRPR